ncbi:MAG: amidohydrolase, partial [Shewanella sp.]
VKNAQGQVVGLNKTTLANEFRQYRPCVAVDAEGNPNGNLTESAVHLVGVPNFLYPLQQNPQELPKIAKKLNKYGITSVQDAWVGDAELALYKTLADAGNMSFRLTAAQAYSVSGFVQQGKVDYAALIAKVTKTRDSLREYPYMKADAVKIMIDGVQEGSIIEVPPTLPTSVMINHFKQPIVNLSALDQGQVSLEGYVDLQSELCQQVRRQADAYDDPDEISNFMAVHHYHPAQCAAERGELLAANGDTLTLKGQSVSAVEFLNTFVTKLDSADFAVHMHAVGDGAVRAAINAIEAAKTYNKNSTLPHTIAHMQVVHPEDQKRLGALGIYLAFTYGWAIPDYFYDMSVMPFVEELSNLEPATLYDEANYYIQASYPAKTAKDAGATLIAGSDAPVDTREPVPFSHMAAGMTRNAQVGDEVFTLNANQTLNVHEMIAAYTINGAKALRQDNLVGSIEVGKRADLIILDRNIVQLAESDDPEKIYEVYDTQVLTTIFDGKPVYQAAAPQ